MTCPRCGAELVEHEPNPRFQRWFECRECEAAWHYVGNVLERGRTPAPQVVRA